MELSKAQLYRATYEAALEFDALRLWEQYDDSVCFPVRLPSWPHMGLGVIMGSGGQEYGLAVYRGPDAGTQLLRMLENEGLDDGEADALDSVSFGMTPLQEFSPVGRDFLRAAKVSAKRSDLLPFFLAKDSGKHPRALSRIEVAEMLMILRGLAKLAREGRLVPSPVVAGAPLRINVLGGDALDPDLAFEDASFPQAPEGAPALLAFPGDLAGLPRLSSSWVIGFPVLPMRINEIEGSVRCLMVADISDGHVLQGEIPERMDMDLAVALLRATFHGKNLRKQRGVPRSAIFTDRELHDAFTPVLTGLGVECSYEPGHPLLEGLKASLSDWLASGKPLPTRRRAGRAGTAGRPDRAGDPTPPPDAVPAPDDLEGWKRVDRSLGKRLGEEYLGGRPPADLSLAKYFGTARAGRSILGGDSPEMAFGGFIEWAMLNYRRGGNKPTAAERLLAGSLPEGERRLLQARLAARPSVYRIVAIDRGGTLTFEDMLFGGGVAVTDRLLAESAEPGYCLVGLVFPAGSFHFLVITGPPLGLGEVTPAIRYLEEQGLEPTHEGIGPTSHLFGRLWSWLERERARRPKVPRMVNFDGDPLEMHAAHFSMTDEAAARAALAKRRDLSFDDDGNAAAWEPAGTPHADRMPGGKVSAGRLRFDGASLVLETNSAERYRRARAWLDKIPGLVFSRLEAQSLDAAVEESQRAAREPDPPIAPAPEALEQVQRALDEQYLKWLDEKIPALGGKTPRQACRTEEGRRHVALMIRTYPDPGGMPGLTVPRAKMFRALGLPE